MWTFQKTFYKILQASYCSSASGRATLRDLPLPSHTFFRILLAARLIKVIFNFHHFVIDYKGFKHKKLKYIIIKKNVKNTKTLFGGGAINN
jgi:hypothetical protein